VKKEKDEKKENKWKIYKNNERKSKHKKNISLHCRPYPEMLRARQK
jgi:hypothetical protein